MKVRRDGAAHLAVEGKTGIGGPMHVAGTLLSRATIDARQTLDVGGDLLGGGNWIVSAPNAVAGDASIVGTLEARSTVAVGGTLIVGQRMGEGEVTYGDYYTDWVRFESPMACQSAPRAAHFVSDIAAHPDADALQRLPHSSLAALTMVTEIELGCGQYRVSAVEAPLGLVLRIVGPTVLLVDGDFRIGGDSRVEIAEGGSLELVVAGTLAIDGPLTIGNGSHGAWLAVGRAVEINAPLVLSGTLLAPSSPVNVRDSFELRGAMMVGALTVNGPLVIGDGPGLSSNGCVDE